MVSFTPKEEKFLNSQEGCRFATTDNTMPHVKPVTYIFKDGIFYIATYYKTRALKNLKGNPNAAIVVDIYKDNGHKAICIQGNTKIFESGEKFQEIYDMFHKRYDWIKEERRDLKPEPYLTFTPLSKVSWGIDTNL